MNVLLIVTDQQRRDSLGCYGNGWANTPNLDALAARGTRFDRAYVTNPICMPNRMSLITGRSPRNHRLWTNGLLLPEQPTLATHLSGLGWQTASIGKMHLQPWGADTDSYESEPSWDRDPSRHDWHGPYFGFEHVEMTLGHGFPKGHYRTWFYAHGGTDEMAEVNPVTGTRPMPKELHHSAYVADRAAHFLREGRDVTRPFFLVASFPDPHHPFDPPAELADRYDPENAPLPVGGPEDLETRPEHYRLQYQGRWHRSGVRRDGENKIATEAEGKRRCACTAAMVEGIDLGVGRIMTALDEAGLRDETLVLFTTDHGELLGDHGLWYKGPFYYEGLLNIPLIVAGPGVEPGRATDALCSTIDLAPTLCDWLQIAPLPGADGVSCAPVLAGGAASSRSGCLVEYRTGYGDADVSSKGLITKRWKYVRYETGEEELTDLREDPQELRNLAADPAQSAVVADMRAQLLDAVLTTELKEPEQLSHA